MSGCYRVPCLSTYTRPGGLLPGELIGSVLSKFQQKNDIRICGYEQGTTHARFAIIFPLKWARSVSFGGGRSSRHCLPTTHVMCHISYCISQSHFEWLLWQWHGLKTYPKSELKIQEATTSY
jgi:hypothetical protein